jgi:hypothetical protein
MKTMGKLSRRSSFFFAALLLCVSCRTTVPLTPANFSEPGWSVRQGQAVWRPEKNRDELVGDLLLATNVNGNLFVQFSKTPFLLATAQTDGSAWQIAFGDTRYFWHGRGQPPARFVWFQLSPALAGEKLEHGWIFHRAAGANWRLENSASGETLEGEFLP